MKRVTRTNLEEAAMRDCRGDLAGCLHELFLARCAHDEANVEYWEAEAESLRDELRARRRASRE